MNKATMTTTGLRFLLALTTIAATVLAAGSASAVLVDYSTSFSNSDSPAFANGQLNGQNSWVAHPAANVSDAAGTGLVNSVNANGPVHIDSSTDVTSELAAGKTITMTLNLNFNAGSYANQNSGAWLLGIGSSATGMTESAATNTGSATFFNNGGANFFTSPIGFLNGDKSDTGIAFDAAFHTLTTTITRSATLDTFDVTADLDGQSNSFTMTNSGLWSGASTAYAGFRYRGGNSGNVDSFSVSSGVIPEPTSLGLFGVACIGLLASRRRLN